MKKSGIPRSELFFTTKIPPQSMGYEKTKEAIAATFEATGLDYVDLYVVCGFTSFILNLFFRLR